jgi:SAM-dependent methyltransferase
VYTACCFRLRQLLPVSLGVLGQPYPEPVESKAGLFKKPAQSALEMRTLDAYHLSAFRSRSSRLRYLENLALIEQLAGLLDTVHSCFPLTLSPFPFIHWLDVGCKNWSIIDALHAVATQHFKLPAERLFLDGIELDPNRLYSNLFSRQDAARSYSRPFQNARYLTGDVCEFAPKNAGIYDVVTCILPFVVQDPFDAWGLPQHYFQPASVLLASLQLLKPGGHLLIINQGETEAEVQQTLLDFLIQEGVPLRYDALGVLPNSFDFYQYPRYGFRCTKLPTPTVQIPTLPKAFQPQSVAPTRMLLPQPERLPYASPEIPVKTIPTPNSLPASWALPQEIPINGKN